MTAPAGRLDKKERYPYSSVRVRGGKMDAKNTKPKISIENSRKELFAELKRNCKGTIIQKEIPFTNQDVPDYLKRLEAIEKESRKTRITVK